MASLSTQDILKFLPTFEGKPPELENFIKGTELVLANFQTLPDPQKTLLFMHIKNQIKGEAREKLSLITANNWEEIKINLRKLFKSHRNENSLRSELFNSINENLKINDCYIKITKLCQEFNSRIDTRGDDLNIKIELKNEFMRDATLIFIKSLKEPTQSQVMAQNLNSIVEVYDYIVNKTNGIEKEINQNKFNKFNKFNSPNPKQPPQPQNPRLQYNQYSRPHFNNFQHQKSNFNNNNKYSRPYNNHQQSNNFRHPRPFKNNPPRSAQTQREHSPMDCSNHENHFLEIGEHKEVRKK